MRLYRAVKFVLTYAKRINPFSYCRFRVSRLTAICQMRHPLKADLGKKNEDDFRVRVCVRPPEQVPRKNSKQSGGGEFLRFRYNFACRPSILISKRMAESLEVEFARL